MVFNVPRKNGHVWGRLPYVWLSVFFLVPSLMQGVLPCLHSVPFFSFFLAGLALAVALLVHGASGLAWCTYKQELVERSMTCFGCACALGAHLCLSSCEFALVFIKYGAIKRSMGILVWNAASDGSSNRVSSLSYKQHCTVYIPECMF